MLEAMLALSRSTSSDVTDVYGKFRFEFLVKKDTFIC